MPDSERARQEYVARLNLVLDHINAHLDEELSLATLARVARFSPFYFHRLFRLLVGESVHDHVRRLRLERAAQLLKADTGRSITGIALDCGFASSASFARAFRQHFGTAARDFRKKWQAEGKNRKDPNGIPRYTGRQYRERSIMKVEVVTAPEVTVAYVRVLGGYKKQLIDQAFQKVCRWAAARNLMGAGTRVLGISHDDPAITPADKCRYDACVEVPRETASSGEIGIATLPAGRYAKARFEGRIERIGDAWAELMRWLPESGFQPDDRPCYEEYLRGGSGDAEQFQVDLYIPVRPL
jgi:AraC family transcriptional regulator